MLQKKLEEACEQSLNELLALAKKPMLYGSLSSSQNKRRKKDGTVVLSAPYLTVSHGSEKGTVSRHVPRGQEASYTSRHKNTLKFREAVEVYIQEKSQLSDLQEGSQDDRQKKTR